MPSTFSVRFRPVSIVVFGRTSTYEKGTVEAETSDYILDKQTDFQSSIVNIHACGPGLSVPGLQEAVLLFQISSPTI